MKEKKEKILDVLSIVGTIAIVVAFFIISRSGFFVGDDWAMGVGLTSFRELVVSTANFYLYNGSSIFSAFCQYLFCGLLHSNKVWFDVVNTIMFLLFVLGCAQLVMKDKKKFWRVTFVFAILFWFLVPAPNETLFWAVGSTAYLWSSVLSLLFLWMFEKHKQDDLPLWENMALMALSLVCMIGIGGFVMSGIMILYYLFHKKEMSKTFWYMFIGCFIAGLLGVLAPGNFTRANVEATGGHFDLVSYLQEAFSPWNVMNALLKYRALWLLVVGLVLLFVLNKTIALDWCRKNIFLLLVLAGGIFVNSTVFAPYITSKRTLLFSETIAIVCLLRLLYGLSVETNSLKLPLAAQSKGKAAVCSIAVIVLFVAFVIDACGAVVETRKQNANNEECLAEIKSAGGVVALDDYQPEHRMAIYPIFPDWTWNPIAYEMGFDSVRILPSLFRETYWNELTDSDAEYGVFDKVDREVGFVAVRHPVGSFPDGVVCTISYNRPKKWYKAWLDKLKNYQYARTSVVNKNNPDLCSQGYCYYRIYLKTENCRNITSVAVAANHNAIN